MNTVRIYVAAICLVGFCSTLRASEERFAAWQSVSATAQLNEPFGKVAVSAQTQGTNSGVTLKSLKITSDGRELVVPAEAVRRIKNPDLSSLKISSEAGYDPHPWLYVSFSLFVPGPGITNWNYPRAYLAFQNGKFIKSFKTERKPGGGRNFFDEWKPEDADIQGLPREGK